LRRAPGALQAGPKIKTVSFDKIADTGYAEGRAADAALHDCRRRVAGPAGLELP
jgi:hypothetical protein